MAGVAEILRRLRVLLTFARVLRVDDSGPLQLIRIEGFIGELREDCPRMGEWGFASNPPDDSQAVVAALGGNRGQLVVLGVEDRETRPKSLAKGESGLYSIGGNRVRLLPDGSIEILGPAGSIEIAPDGSLELAGPVGSLGITAAGTVTLGGLTISATATGAITISGAATVSIAGAGAVAISGSTVTLGASTTIDGKPFLPHTHLSAAPGVPTGPVI